MKSTKSSILTVLTVLTLLLWTDRAHAHEVPLYVLPVVTAFVFLPIAFLSAFLGWLGKGIYFSGRTSLHISMVTCLLALKEAGILYGCFMLVTVVVDVGAEFIEVWPQSHYPWGLRVCLALTVVLSALLSRFLQVRFLNTTQEDLDRQSSAIAKPWLVFLLGLIAPVIFSLVFYMFFVFHG